MKHKFIVFFIVAAIASISCIVTSTYLKNQFKSEIELKNNEIELKNNEITRINEDNAWLNQQLNTFKQEEYDFRYLGKFKITYYCNEPYAHICGYGKRTTASGQPTDVGKTIAVDTSLIPFGTKVYIDGMGWYEAQDRGGAIKAKKIDVLVDYHDEALQLGTTYKDVWVLIDHKA